MALGRRDRVAMWVALALTAVAAVATPALRTDWGTWRAQRSFTAIAAPAGWTPDCAHQVRLSDEADGTVGRTIGRTYRPLRLVDPTLQPAALLAHYQKQLPGFTCSEAPPPMVVVCASDSARLTVATPQYGGDGPSVSFTTCTNGAPRGTDLAGTRSWNAGLVDDEQVSAAPPPRRNQIGID